MNEQFATSAIAAVEAALAPSLSITTSAMREAASVKRKALSLEYARVLSSGAFGDGRGYEDVAAVAATSGGDASQFGFDLTLCCLFTLLADARIPRDAARECSRQLGTRLLDEAIPPPPTAPRRGKGSATPLPIRELVGGMRAYLDALQRAGYMASYSLDDTDADEALWAQRSSLSPTRLSITLTESASLRAALLLNGRQNASPELARPLLLAFLRENGAVVTESQEFFLDSVYRSSPLDYRPNQQVLTLTVEPAPRE